MEKTGNYQLSLWDKDDRILMEDFNANNTTLDAALAAEAEAREALTEAVNLRGNCQVQYQTYTGTGSTSVSFTLPHRPLLVVVFGDNVFFFAVRGRKYATARAGGSGAELPQVSWSGNRVSWTFSDTAFACNTSGQSYSMVAIMDVTN